MSARNPEPPRSGLGGLLRRVGHFFTVDLWTGEPLSISRFRALGLRTLRILALAAQRFFEQRTPFHASGLTYITILSLVPVLAVAFSMAKGLGAYERLRNQVITPFLDEYIGPSPPAGEVVEETGGPAALRSGVDQVVEFVDRTDFSVLGLFASALMLFTVIKLLSAVERSLNEIWGVRRARSLVRKFSDYLTLVIVSPLLVLTATGVTASTQLQRVLDTMRQYWDFDPLLRFFAPVATLLIVWAGFTFVYLVIPNTRVKMTSALFGGIVGGTLWQLVQILHVKLQIGMAQYELLYAGFAAFPILLLWIYLSWVVVLLGAHAAFAYQNERSYRGIALFREPDQALREIVALRALVRIGKSFRTGRRPPAQRALALKLGVPERALTGVLENLARDRIVAPTGPSAEGRYLPGRDLARITVADVLESVRRAGHGRGVPARGAVDQYVADLLRQIRQDVAASAANKTLLEMVEHAERSEPKAAESEAPVARPGEARA